MPVRVKATWMLRRVNPIFGNQVMFALVDGVIRLAIFLSFLWVLSKFSDIRRMFQYHGAEHKTVFCFEAGDKLDHWLAQNLMVAAWALGIAGYAAGLLLSTAFDLPTGPTIVWALVVLASAWFAVASSGGRTARNMTSNARS